MSHLTTGRAQTGPSLAFHHGFAGFAVGPPVLMRPVAYPAAHVLHAHDRIAAADGSPGSFPTLDRTPFSPGL